MLHGDIPGDEPETESALNAIKMMPELERRSESQTRIYSVARICMQPSFNHLPLTMNPKEIYDQVQDHYGSIARAEGPAYSNAIAKQFGYSEEELSSIPVDSNLGLSCGNPLAIASLREVSSAYSNLVCLMYN